MLVIELSYTAFTMQAQDETSPANQVLYGWTRLLGLNSCMVLIPRPDTCRAYNTN
jgi:uncharacterized protein YmfQ (DUF2313 family)